jgi:type I restriction enzyme, S subunit
MNPAKLLTHFDRISEAPDAIPRLRRFILDLAVRGKLVEQDPRDEPASALLKRIDAEKDLLLRQGKIRKQEVPEDLDESEIPFKLPADWIWSRLGNIGDWGSGSTPPRGSGEYYGGEVTWLKSGELGDSLALRGSEERVTAAAVKKCSFRLNQPGDVLIAMYGATIGKLAILAEPAVTNQAVCGCTPFAGILNRYLFIYLLSRRAEFHAQSEGGAQPNISKVKIVLSPFALPPLAEQHRIVAKVDELMALCDRLESAQTARESRRDRLAASSLNRLNNGADADTFHDHARFYFNHLPRLTTRPEHIRQLRQTILNLAVRGKLVTQDPNDEPASALLKRINAEQGELIKTRALKPNGEDSQSLEEDLAFDLPQTWYWAPLSSIIVFGPQNGLSPKPSSRPDAPIAITLTATTSGQFNPQHFKRVEANIPPDSEFWLRPGDLLFQRGNTREYVGIAAYYTGEPRLFLYPDLMMKVRISQKVSLRYVHLWAIAPPARAYFSTHATGAQATMPKINQGTLLQLPVPIPPLAEQHRIVDKVDELMVLCDGLEAQLTTSQTESRRLLEAVLLEALNGGKT